jgi:hypothetical protein
MREIHGSELFFLHQTPKLRSVVWPILFPHNVSITNRYIPVATMPPPAVSDLAQLWQAAVQDYEKRTGKSLQLRQFRSMEEVIGGTEDLSNKFKGFRDDKSKVAKVRTAFKNNMWLIQTLVNTMQTVGNTASVSFEKRKKKTDSPNRLRSPGLSAGHASEFNIFSLRAGHAGTGYRRML